LRASGDELDDGLAVGPAAIGIGADRRWADREAIVKLIA